MVNKRKANRYRNRSSAKQNAKRLNEARKKSAPARSTAKSPPCTPTPKSREDWTRKDYIEHNKKRPALPPQQQRAGYTQVRSAAGKWKTKSPGKGDTPGRVFWQGGEKLRTHSIPNHIRNPRPELKPQDRWLHKRPLKRKRQPSTPCCQQHPPTKLTPAPPAKNVVPLAVRTPPLMAKRSKHDYGFFVQPGDNEDEFHGIMSWKNCKDFFVSLSTSCNLVQKNGKPCGGKYVVADRVESGTGGEFTFAVTCGRCHKQHVCGDGARNAAERQHPTGCLTHARALNNCVNCLPPLIPH